MTSTAADKPISYAGYQFPPEVISCAVWLYFRFPLSPHVVEDCSANTAFRFQPIEVTLKALTLKQLISPKLGVLHST